MGGGTLSAKFGERLETTWTLQWTMAIQRKKNGAKNDEKISGSIDVCSIHGLVIDSSTRQRYSIRMKYVVQALGWQCKWWLIAGNN
jgi:hypothetical protein